MTHPFILLSISTHCKHEMLPGGEEFVLSLLNTKLEQAVILVERIRKSLVNLGIPHRDSPIAPHITISFGIASVKPLAGQKSQNLILLADKALYQAKEDGRNRYAYQAKKKGDFIVAVVA